VRLVLPTWQTVVKWTLSGLLAIILSAIGSGVWQLLGSGLHTVSRWVLDLASLGLSNYKNWVYQQVAADDQTWFAVETLLLVTMIFTLVAGSGILYFLNKNDQDQRFFKKLLGTPPNNEPAGSEEDLKKRAVNMLKSSKRFRLSLYFLSFACLFIYSETMVSLVRRHYVSSADAHYHQVLHVALPYLDTAERSEVESEFAQISSRSDYVKVLSKLEKLCNDHSRYVPAFEPW